MRNINAIPREYNMNIIIIVLCFLADRYYPIGNQVRHYGWFERYVSYLQNKWLNTRKMSEWPTLLLILLPLIIITAVLQFLLFKTLWGIPGFLFNFIVLFYCLGPTHLKELYQHYFAAKERGDYAAAYASVSTREPQLFDNETEMSRGVTQQIFVLSNENIIAVIFWYLLLGATGALMYRLIVLLTDYAKKSEDFYQPVGQLSISIKQYLDWIPVRILALCYAIAGNFVECFAVWVHYLFLPPHENNQLLVDCGLAALGKNPDVMSTTEDIEAVELIDRVMVVILVILALMTLASWLS